ncbi:hypothetical protein MFLAVUS_004754 [Mucor flavus]|uniref:Uncharacterized protein n=1 Tax=Mucor flavus TaxID=439312 RepID=A0ABP9YWT3_9FUNG
MPKLCLQLTDLKFTSNFNRSEQRVEHTVKLNKKLRHLYINLPSLSINYTKDLTRYLEDTLHTVSFTGLYFWIENVGIENSLNLMKKLGQLNDVCISFRRSNGSLRTRRLTYAIKMTWWFQVVNAFKGDKKALCTVKFCGTSSSQDYFKYSALDNQLILAYTLEDVDYRALENINYNESEYVYYNEREDANHYVREDEIDEAVHYEREDVYYSEREYEYYSEIDEADFYESENVYYGERGYDSHIYRPCESLSKSALPISFISIIGPEIIDRVELNLEEVSDNVYLKVTGYFQIQRRPNHRNEELNGTQNNLKTLHFLSGAPANNILNSIFKHLPDIEVLVLGTRGKYNSSLDLRQFKSLRRCYIIIQQTSTYNCEALTIKFNCTDGKKRQYYYDGAVKKTLVREDIRGSIRICRSFTFTFEKETEFFVYFDSGESILNFNIDKHPDSCIPVNFI